MSFLLAALSVALVAAVLALAREVRLRRALERLLRLLLSHWRNRAPRPQIPDCDRLSADDPSVDDERLQ